ncbi:MAG TPA: type II toxin-antitoxin system VapC family toxin [Actinomycetota bacterium]|nr:type II toxin-antitoxin system VapC family toxin [Actinomycetota bacterium]
MYLDASALVKLAAREPESDALVGWLTTVIDARVSSALSLVEVPRALRRADPHRHLLERADRVLRAVEMIDIDSEILEMAAAIEPRGLRSLDAIHLATAMLLGPREMVLVTYDARLADAARAAGFEVEAPA